MVQDYRLNEVLNPRHIMTLLPHFGRTDRALVRLDERVRRSHDLARGYQRRLAFNETCSNVWLNGALVHLEDLVLHDFNTDARLPSHDLTQAAQALRLYRRVAEIDNLDHLLNQTTILALINRTPELHGVPIRDQEQDEHRALFAKLDALNERASNLVERAKRQKTDSQFSLVDTTNINQSSSSSNDALATWLSLHQSIDSQLSPSLIGAVLLDAWLVLEPLKGRDDLGRLLCAAYIRDKLSSVDMPPLFQGLQKARSRWQASDSAANRIRILLNGLERGIQEATQLLNRLALSQERMLTRAPKTRENSNMHRLIALFIENPFISTVMARQALKISAPTVDNLLNQLGPTCPPELTGRGRFRAWGVL